MFAMADGDDLPAGVFDPDAADADVQRALGAYLVGRGIPVDEVRAANAEQSMSRLVAGAALWPDPTRITISEVAERAGVSTDTARRVRRVLGLADPGDEAVCRAREVDLIQAFRAGLDIFGEERTMQFARVIGTSTAAVSEAANTLFAGDVGAAIMAAGATDAEFGIAARDAMLAFEGVVTAVEVTLRLQFERALARLGGDLAVDQLAYAIAFVDVAESTVMAGALGGAEVAVALRDFDRIVTEAAARHDVRLVKLIGDGAMLAARDVAPLANAVADAVAQVEEHDVLKAAKAGVTFGPVAAHDGDYFGQVVNLAARASSAATAGEVLFDAEAANALPGRTAPAGDYDLKGFAEPVPLYRLTVERNQP